MSATKLTTGLRRGLWILAVVAVLITGMICLDRMVFSNEYSRLKSVRVGMSVAEVVTALGEPSRRYTAVTAPANYYVKGYGYSPRSISDSVLIYIYGEQVLYVYIDRSQRVEDVREGGT